MDFKILKNWQKLKLSKVNIIVIIKKKSNMFKISYFDWMKKNFRDQIRYWIKKFAFMKCKNCKDFQTCVATSIIVISSFDK
ncbi:hypothetical protein KUTeg_022160 [Tegillarca granosa]|uniref:Uncharacterized protein n=1 Tax=Tegillarca granosa TaxID=220873 RepID=A0ABQ9EA01_TEGGR|nr:hypothetical protein KUTeg_022160 [Tegillarca granosa]